MMNRRRFLSLACAGGALLMAPRLVFASVETDRRFIFIIQRGAADGLHIVPPYTDPNYAKLRGALAILEELLAEEAAAPSEELPT